MRNLHLISASTLALALAACGPQQQTSNSQVEAPVSSLALTQGDTAPASYAPAAAQLPAAKPLRLASAGVERQPYSYIDDAYDLGDAFGDSPPDYTIDYQGTRPLIWRSQAGAYRVVEQTPDGERDYYYRAGADQPFLVRDPRYSYAYDGGDLAVVYDSAGRPVAQDIAARDAAVAARYLDRARQIYAAAIHQQRQAAQASDWQARRNAVLASQRDWNAQQQRNDDWRRWRDQQAQDDRARQQQAALQQERAQRQASAAQMAGVVAAAAIQHRQDVAVDQARAQQAQSDARAQDQARRQQQAVNDARTQQARADAVHAQDEARRQQQAAAQAQSQDHQRQMQADAARRDQAHAQQAQADAARRDQAQAQARQQQAQAEAARRDQAGAQARQQQQRAETARRDAQAHQQQAEVQAQQAHQQQAQAQAAQVHAQQAQAAQAHAQQAQAEAQAKQAQAEQAKRVQAEAQAHPAPAPGQPDAHGPAHGHGDKHGPRPDGDKDHDKPKPPGA